MADPIDKHDARKRRCPRLGHELAVSYCRSPGADLPCRRIFDCWWETFDVEGFLRQHLSEEQIDQLTAPGRDKRVTLLDLVEQARRRMEDTGR